MSEVVDGTVEDEDPVEAGAQAADPPPHAPDAVAPIFSAPPPAPRRAGGELVRTQAAAVAATGFAVGAVTVVALSRRRTRKAIKQKAKGKGGREIAGVVASRSFLVDVHLLGPKE